MKCLARNKQRFWYALYSGKTEMSYEYGSLTGEFEANYENPVEQHGNISAAEGETQARQFGESVMYDKVIILDNPNTPIDEHTVLWVDTCPVLVGGRTDTPYDYVVQKVARSLNNAAVAIRKVDVR